MFGSAASRLHSLSVGSVMMMIAVQLLAPGWTLQRIEKICAVYSSSRMGRRTGLSAERWHLYCLASLAALLHTENLRCMLAP